MSGATTNISSQVITYTNSFSAGQVVRLDNGSSGWFLAQADNVTDAEATGVVASASATGFTIIYMGLITNLASLTPGECYFLSPTVAGAVTTVAPSAFGTVSKPVMRAITSSTAVVVNERGYLNSDNALLLYPNVQGVRLVTSNPYVVQSTDEYIGINVATPTTVYLPAIAGIQQGLYVTIKDESGNAKTNNITLSGAGVTVDGQATYLLNYNYEAVSLIYNGTNWFII